jgi:hypothetical protein
MSVCVMAGGDGEPDHGRAVKAISDAWQTKVTVILSAMPPLTPLHGAFGAHQGANWWWARASPVMGAPASNPDGDPDGAP